jgi:NAD(P)-dependent dehydrogenase (short-subunit alcohol dehydrogenase family)
LLRERVSAGEDGMSDQDLQGKVAIVTGGGGGIGAAVAGRLARAGAAVAVVDIDSAAAAEVVAGLVSAGLRAGAFAADVAEEEAVRAVVAEAIQAYGRLDILVNNAVNNRPQVFGSDRGLLEMAVEVWDATFAVNVRGPMLLAKHGIPHMIAQASGGAIVNMSSLASEHPGPALTAYGASKGALNTLTSYIAAQHGAQNIRCNALVCGVVATQGLRNFFSAEQIDAMAANTMLRRVSTPEDIAALAHFLVSEPSRQLTGRLIRV